MTVKDVPGVIAAISSAFAKNSISINSIQQQVQGQNASIIFMIHKTGERGIKKALEAIRVINTVESIDALIRVEE